MEEKVFLDSNGIKVTSARFISGGQTYAMSNVTSVKTAEKKPSKVVWIILFLIGAVLMATRNETPVVVGLFAMMISVGFMVMAKSQYHLMLTTSAGEASALTTDSQEFLNEVVKALNEAIVCRG